MDKRDEDVPGSLAVEAGSPSRLCHSRATCSGFNRPSFRAQLVAMTVVASAVAMRKVARRDVEKVEGFFISFCFCC